MKGKLNMQTITYGELKKKTNAREKLELCINDYKNLFSANSGALKSQINQDMVNEARKNLLDSINNILTNGLFSDDVLKSLKDFCVRVFNETRIETYEHFQAIQKLQDFETEFIIDIPDELAVECFKKTKSKFNKIKNHYEQHSVSQQDVYEFVDELNIYLNTNTEDAKSLYDDIKVPVFGLFKHLDKNDIVGGCIDDIENILNRHLDKFLKNKDAKTLEIKEKDVKTAKCFDNKKSHENIEAEEDTELGLNKQGKGSKLRDAVSAVLDKKSERSKKVNINWVNKVMKNAFNSNS